MTDQTNLPEPLKDVVERLAKLPGLGPKSALRAAMQLLKWPEDQATGLGRSILTLREKLCICPRCGSLSDTDPCHLCADPNRDETTLCLVAEWDALLALERGHFYKGRYMILGGLLAPLDGVEACNLEVERLRRRLAEGEVTELILALGATLEGENTASFVKNLARRDFPHVAVRRLAQGIPLGAHVKDMDHETLRQSLAYRQEF